MVASPLRGATRRALLAVNAPRAKARLQRAVRSAPEPVALEVGGRGPRPGWLVAGEEARASHRLDVTKRWPIDDGALSFVYADNIIEDMSLDAGRAFLAEAHRCLQPGGVIRLVTPDLRAHVDKYLAGSAPKGDPGAKVYEQMGLTVDHPIDWVRIPIASFGHHTGYLFDFDTLASELVRAGFTNVVHSTHGHSDHPELAGLDQRADEGGVQLAVEATR
jgi:hypothetical protein